MLDVGVGVLEEARSISKATDSLSACTMLARPRVSLTAKDDFTLFKHPLIVSVVSRVLDLPLSLSRLNRVSEHASGSAGDNARLRAITDTQGVR